MPGLFQEIKHLSKHAVTYGISTVLSRAIGFVMIPIYTRYLSPSDYGVLEILELAMNLLSIIVGVGLADAVARFFYLYETEEGKSEVVSSALILLSLLTGITGAIGYVYSNSLSIILFSGAQYSDYVRVSLISFVFSTVLELPLVYIRARERSFSYSTISIARLVVGLGLNIFFLVYMKLGVIGILYSSLISSIVFSGYLLTAVIRETGVRPNWRLQWEMAKFGGPLIFVGLGMFLIHFGDRFFLNKAASLAEVGIYSLGYKFGMMGIGVLIHEPFFLIWSVRKYEIIKQPDGERLYGQMFFVFGVISLLAWLALSLFASEIVYLVANKSFSPAYRYIPLIAFAYVLRGFGNFFTGILMIEKKTKYGALVTVSGTLFCLTAYIALIPRWLGMGAAMATVLTFIYICAIAFLFARKYRRIDYNLGKMALSCLVAISLWFVSLYIEPGFRLSTVLMKFALILIFAGFVLIQVGFKRLIAVARQMGIRKESRLNGGRTVSRPT
jgi:O-antigen/teichoic acid export membrane protein